MGRWLAVFEDAADASDEGPLSLLERAHLPASRTGLVFAQPVGLLPRRRFQCPGHEAVQGRHRHVFHLRNIDVQAGAFLAPVLPHDNFPPAFGQFFDPLQVFRTRFAPAHGASLQQVAIVSRNEILT